MIYGFNQVKNSKKNGTQDVNNYVFALVMLEAIKGTNFEYVKNVFLIHMTRPLFIVLSTYYKKTQYTFDIKRHAKGVQPLI